MEEQEAHSSLHPLHAPDLASACLQAARTLLHRPALQPTELLVSPKALLPAASGDSQYAFILTLRYWMGASRAFYRERSVQKGIDGVEAIIAAQEKAIFGALPSDEARDALRRALDF